MIPALEKIAWQPGGNGGSPGHVVDRLFAECSPEIITVASRAPLD
jgi:hypothetical protein